MDGVLVTATHSDFFQKVMSSDISDGMEVETLQGEKFTVNMKDGKATITGGDILPAATVETGDIAVSNGVAHVIDQVLIPPTISKALKGGAAEKPADDKKAGAAPAPATARPRPRPRRQRMTSPWTTPAARSRLRRGFSSASLGFPRCSWPELSSMQAEKTRHSGRSQVQTAICYMQ